MHIYFQYIWSTLKVSSFTYITNFKASVDKVMWLKDFFYITICASVIFLIYTQAYNWLQYTYIISYLTVLIPD